MMHQQERETQVPDKRKRTFRVWTATDFGIGRKLPEKHRAGHLTTACRMCRLRKVKCVISDRDQSSESARSARCQPCKNSSLDCKWDVIDGRKRKRGKPSDLNQNAPDTDTQLSSENCQELSDPNHGLEIQNDSHISTNQKEINPVELGGRNASNGVRQDVGHVAQSTESGSTSAMRLNTNDYQEPQLPFEELCAEAGVEISQDWPDLEDFVFSVDVFDHVDNHFQQYLLPANGERRNRAKGEAPTGVSPRPRIGRLRYYRRLGPTAVVPGFHKLSVAVNLDQDESCEIEQSNLESEDYASRWSTSSPSSAALEQNQLFDKSTCQPHSDVMPVILDVFFEHFEGHFPFLNPEILGGHVRAGEASSFLLNAIAALTVRFCSSEGPLAYLHERYTTNWSRGIPFLKKAKEQLVSLLSLPEPEVIAGLIILSWAEFGDNNETGLWMIAGMAIRMAQDLGLHRTPEMNTDPNASFHDSARPSQNGEYTLTDAQSATHQQKARLVMFWSVFILDVCVSLVTGRPPTIRRSEIETPLPTAQDMKLVQLDFDEQISMKNLIFPQTVAFMLHFSEALGLLNQPPLHRGSDSGSLRTGRDLDGANLSRIRQDLLRSYNALPPELVFTIANYKLSLSSNQSGLYLVLHLFFYTFMILLSNPSPCNARQSLRQEPFVGPSISNTLVGTRPSTESGPDDENENRSEIAIIACQKMAQILTISDLVDQKGYLATPFINHCFFVAASTILHDSDFRRKGQRPPQDTFLGSVANVDYEFFSQKLREQGKYFGAINSVTAVLDRWREAPVNDREHRTSGSSDDERGDGPGRVVTLGDPGIINRYTVRS